MTPHRLFPGARCSWRTFAIAAGLCAVAGQAGAQDLAYSGGKAQALIFENQINVAASVPTTYFGMVGNAWGYGGIQMNQDEAARTGIFSIWDTTELTTEYAYNATLDIKKHGRFGGEGTGAQFLFNYAWRYGTDYRCAYRVFPEPDGIHVRFNAFFYDGSLGAWTYVATYRAATGGVALQTDRFYSFIENYGDTFGPRTATYSNAWMYVAGTGWTDLTGGKIFNIPPGDQPQQTNRPDFGQIATGPLGFTIHSDTNPATQIQNEWDSVAYTATAADRIVPIPYFLSCGNANAQGNWEPDTYWKDLAGDSVMVHDPAPVCAGEVDNAAPQAVYQNARHGSNFQYELLGFVPNAEYTVKLHFVEPDCTTRGARLQDVTINGKTVLKSFDIFREAGGRHRAIARAFTGKADALGRIVVQFAKAKGSQRPDAVVSAITATQGRPGFRVVPGADTVEVMKGFGATTTETVLSLEGFSDPTHLWVLGLPCGVTGTFSPARVDFQSGSAAPSATLTLTASSHAPLENGQEAVVVGLSEEGTRWAPIKVSVAAPRPKFVQAGQSVYADAAASLQATYKGAQVAGDLNVLAVQWQDATANITSVTDTAGNTYVLAAGPTRNPDQPGTQAIYYASAIHAAPAGGNTVTVAFDSQATYPDVLIADYAGVRTLDQVAVATGSTEELATAAVATTAPNELLFSAACVAWWTDAPGAGFTTRFQADWGNLIQDQTVSRTGSYQATALQKGGAPWILQLVTFK
jgi:hypothetical protein